MGLNVSAIYITTTQHNISRDLCSNDDIECHLASRRTTMLSYCKTQNLTSGIPRNLLVDDKRKLMYCFIHKVGSSVTRKALINSTAMTSAKNTSRLNIHNFDILRQFGLNTLDKYSWPEIKKRQESYFKVVFVRHPFRRLLSAFRDRFQCGTLQGRHWFHAKFGRDIIRRYRPEPSKESLNLGHDVTFSEFLQFVLDEFRLKHRMDGHWQTYQTACQPCTIKYDMIGHLETIDQDLPYFMHKIDTSRDVKTTYRYGPTSLNGNMSTDKAYEEYFSQIPQDYIDRLYSFYKHDFLMFGFTKDI